MRTWIYARVSTFDQYLTGHSIEAQVQACLAHVKNHGMILGLETNCGIPGVFIDGGKSAFTKKFMQRPGGIALASLIRTGDTVVATATHRMFRRTSDLLNMMEGWVSMGVSVIFTDYPMLNTNTANGRAMLSLFGIIAQLKSELTSARMKEAYALSKGKSKKVAPVKPMPEAFAQLPDTNYVEVMLQIAKDRDVSNLRFTGKIRAYVRVSTKDQTVEQQKQCILQQLPEDMRGSEIIWYSDEAVSAFKTNMTKRPAGSKLLADLQEGDILVAWRPDRVFRSLLDMANTTDLIHSKGAFILTVEGGMRTDTPFGRTMVSLLSMMAEIESQEISRSTKQGQMVALATNPAEQRRRLPKYLRESLDTPDQIHFSFNQMFSRQDRMHMYLQLSLTCKQYRGRKMACRVISNKWLKMKGLPQLTGLLSDTHRLYTHKVKQMQKEEFSERRQKLLEVLKKYDKESDVNYPLNVDTIAHVMRRQEVFLKTARKISGQIKDKQTLVSLASQCVSADAAVELIEVLK